MDDPILKDMAEELRQALIGAGLDPKKPPEEEGYTPPPSDSAFARYKTLGGEQYTDPDEFTKDLIKEVSK